MQKMTLRDDQNPESKLDLHSHGRIGLHICLKPGLSNYLKFQDSNTTLDENVNRGTSFGLTKKGTQLKTL